MSLENVTQFILTPEFYSGLVTGALIARTVQQTIRGLIKSRFSGDS